MTKILGGFRGSAGEEGVAVVDAGEQGTLPAQKEPVTQVGEAHQEKGEQGAALAHPAGAA